MCIAKMENLRFCIVPNYFAHDTTSTAKRTRRKKLLCDPGWYVQEYRKVYHEFNDIMDDNQMHKSCLNVGLRTCEWLRARQDSRLDYQALVRRAQRMKSCSGRTMIFLLSCFTSTSCCSGTEGIGGARHDTKPAACTVAPTS